MHGGSGKKQACLQLTPDWTRRSPGAIITGHPCARNLLEAFSGTCNLNQSNMSYTSIIQPFSSHFPSEKPCGSMGDQSVMLSLTAAVFGCIWCWPWAESPAGTHQVAMSQVNSICAIQLSIFIGFVLKENIKKNMVFAINPMVFALQPICKAPVLGLLYLCSQSLCRQNTSKKHWMVPRTSVAPCAN